MMMAQRPAVGAILADNRGVSRPRESTSSSLRHHRGTDPTEATSSRSYHTQWARGSEAGVFARVTGAIPRCTRRALTVRAQESQGLGFTRSTEKWVGRVAIFGQMVGMVRGFSSGQGILQQLGFTPSVPLALCLSAVGCSLVSAMTAMTMLRYMSGDLDLEELQGYTTFFEGMPMPAYLRNTFLTGSEESAASPTEPLSKPEALEPPMPPTPEGRQEMYMQSLIYLPDAEVTRIFDEREQQEVAMVEALGARAAMLWFITSVGIEAFTGTPVEDQLTRFLTFFGSI